MRYLSLLFFLCSILSIQAQPDMTFSTPFENDPDYSASYQEVVDFYKKLAASSPILELQEYGMTDAGFPIHLAVLSSDKVFDPVAVRKSGKRIMMINNAIHPGEPCGVDATMMLYRDILKQAELQQLLDKVVLIAIPFYNIGGGLNRGSYSRANQDGPKEHGFRGNARNLDLNRDFIKCDSKNAQTFNQLFNRWDPDFFDRQSHQ